MTLPRTPSQTVGPFFSLGLCRSPSAQVVPDGSVRLVGQVLDGAGDPVPDALVELWQPGEGRTHWGRCATDAGGCFEFVTERPPGGHADVLIFARGLLKHLITRCYFEATDDAVLAGLDERERRTLVAQQDGDLLRFDIRLQGDRQTVFFGV